MITQILILLFSLFLVVFSANCLVDGASAISKRLGISTFIIGMFVVGFGTSLPELVVSLFGAIEGNTDVSLGNIIGSNIFNTGAILGLSALIAPISVSMINIKRDIPFMLTATMVFLLFGLFGDGINRFESVSLLMMFGAYLFYMYKTNTEEDNAEEIATPRYVSTLPLSIVVSVLSIAGLIVGGKFFVDSGVRIGSMIGLSNKVIGITILAFGTSLPELATCIVAVFKKQDQMALGDIVGSNIFNMLLIIGMASIVHPLGFGNITVFDILAFVLCASVVFLSQITKHKGQITRLDGGILLALFFIYMIILFR